MMRFSVGLGLTNACNLSCAHCYRDTGPAQYLTLADVRRVCESLPVRAANLGTGENGLHPEFHTIVGYLRDRDVATSITSNGYTLSILDDEPLRAFHDVEVSIDFPTEAEQDAFRGPGNWRLVLEQLDRCRRLGVTTTVIAVMMRTNYDRLAAVAGIAAEHGAYFRVNVYQPVKADVFTLTYEQYWEGFRRLFAATRVVGCSEPLVNAILGLGGGCGCGRSTVRITPRAEVLPCVYWPNRALTLADLEDQRADIPSSAAFQEVLTVPAACQECAYVATCGGGCASRRALRGRLDEPDEYCPIVRGDHIALDYRPAVEADLPKVGSACTTIVQAEPIERRNGARP
jgi:radical SAM protein with 4Fe4S-binding SPASM domain